MGKLKDLEKLKKSILKAKNKFPGKNLVFADGNCNSKIMIIGEAPGRTEDKLQLPFVGRAGKILNELLSYIKLDRSKVYITNVVNFRPDENRKPTENEIYFFKKFLIKHIQIINPKFLLLVGSTAAFAILNHSAPLADIRGKWIKSKELNLDTFTIYHPAYLLRQSAQVAVTKKDMLKFKTKVTKS